jgi:L-rhamnose-H+ transport protein
MNVILGAFLAVIGGAINGMFALPMKVTKKWSWENVWLPFSALALVVFPYLVATIGAPNLLAAYQHCETSAIVTAVLCGVAAYGGSLLFGISLGMIGNSLAFSLLVGSMSVVGVLIPNLAFHPATLLTRGGKWIDVGIALLFVALIVCARAGTVMATAKAGDGSQKGGGSAVITGMLLAIAGGALSGLMPLGMSMDWAKGIHDAAVTYGHAQPAAAQNVLMLLILLGGAIPNCFYALWLLVRNRTFQSYRVGGSYWLLILLMGVMYTGSVIMFAMSSSASMLGQLGPSVGWALFIGGLVVSSNVGGFATGEWKGAGSLATRLMVSGIVVMVIAVSLVGYGNYLLNQG